MTECITCYIVQPIYTNLFLTLQSDLAAIFSSSGNLKKVLSWNFSIVGKYQLIAIGDTLVYGKNGMWKSCFKYFFYGNCKVFFIYYYFIKGELSFKYNKVLIVDDLSHNFSNNTSEIQISALVLLYWLWGNML